MQRDHGTISGFKGGCPCDPCRLAWNAYQRRVRRLKAYGEWDGHRLVDAEPARQHVRELQASGLGLGRIAAAADVGQGTLFALMYGDPAGGVEPTKRAAARRVQAILDVRPTLDLFAPGATIDATGTRRRLQALTALGWSSAAMASKLGRDERSISKARVASTVLARSARDIRDLYDELWDKRPHPLTPGERISVTKSLRLAAERGWPPPMAWDDDTIDDPNARPDGVGPARPSHVKLPDDDELQWLIGMGETVAALAMRFDIDEKSVRTRVQRLRSKQGAAA